jgi:hypothetical protein
MSILSVAQSQIGVKENPANSNRVKYSAWYGLTGPWCDMFVSWCANQAGVANVIGKYAYCPYHVACFKKKGWWHGPEYKPQAGDIVFFASRGVACHVGIVEKRNGTQSVTTIEGNTSVSSNDNGGAVMRRVRTYGNPNGSWGILGFAHPDYGKGNGKITDTKAAVVKTATKAKASGNHFDSWVAELQKECNRQGYSKQAVDGEAGPATLAGCPTVRKGAKGNITKLLQRRLIALGFACGRSGADGDFGTGTRNAVIAFQRAKGLTADGIVGQNTWRKLLGL